MGTHRRRVLLTAGAVLAGAVLAGVVLAGFVAVGPARPAAPAPAAAVRLAVPTVVRATLDAAPGVPQVHQVPQVHSALGPGTGWPALDAAVARIPGYPAAAPTTWRVSDRYGHLGSTLLPAEEISISASLRTDLLDAVVRHEWSHVLQSRAYGGDTAAMVAALDAAFGGAGTRGVDGVENAADCMARQLGATWTHYTDCRDPRWRAAAAVLLSGARL